MRERTRDKGRLEDIIEHADNIAMFMEGYTLEMLRADKRTYYSVMKNVEIIGEAAYMLTNAFKSEHPETPWKIIQGMRHVLVHDYSNVVPETLFDTAINSIPELRCQVDKYLTETDWETWQSENDCFDESDEIENINSK